MAIQGHVFWGQWKGDEGLKIDVFDKATVV